MEAGKQHGCQWLPIDLSNVELRARDFGSISHEDPAGLDWGAWEGLSLGLCYQPAKQVSHSSVPGLPVLTWIL